MNGFLKRSNRYARHNVVHFCAERRQVPLGRLEAVEQFLEMNPNVVRRLLQCAALLALKHSEDIVRQMPHGLFHVVGIDVLDHAVSFLGHHF